MNRCLSSTAALAAGILMTAHAGSVDLPSVPILYQLQNLDITQAAASAFPIIVTDYSRDGSPAGEFTAGEVATLKAGGRKIVLAYLSIGEAENYRYYWNPRWNTAAGRPAWLGPVNPDWPGNFEVRYWDPAWQAIIFGATNSYLDRIIAQGFDGVYLDIVDGFEFWGPDGNLPAAQQNPRAASDMIAFVTALANYARAKPGHANFYAVPQNAAILGTNTAYRALVSGIGSEDNWFNGDKRQPARDTLAVTGYLDLFRNAGKPVFAIDYPKKTANVDAFYSFAESRGYIPYAPPRNLDRFVIPTGHDPAATLTVTLHAPPDNGDVRLDIPPTFTWGSTGSAPMTYRLNFAGNAACQRIVTLPSKTSITTTNYTPTVAEWKAIMALGGRITWWVTARDNAGQLRSARARQLCQLHTGISTTVFWIGEPGDADNGYIPNAASAWDELWQSHYGGVDDPAVRNADSAHPYWPTFTPGENPFYAALPYNDFDNRGNRRRNFRTVIPWAASATYGDRESAVKNRWLKIIASNKVCYAQWEDIGPFGENDARYVFGFRSPRNKINDRAGLDTSPAVQQYLHLTGLDKTDWRFVFPDEELPAGPWTEVITTNQITWLP